MSRERIRDVLDLARWAPSGDNTQPWRFEIVDDANLVVHGFDTRAHCVYDLDGRASQLALGALVETIRIAAGAHGLAAEVHSASEPRPGIVRIEMGLSPTAVAVADPLIPCIKARCTQRRAMSPRRLPDEAKRRMEECLGADHQVIWFEGFRTRVRFARLMMRNGKLRLTLPEAYPVHRDVIEWGVSESADRIPERAVGVDPMTAKLMRWALQSWDRVDFLNTYLGGTLVPGVELDLVPGVACGAHFAIFSRSPLAGLDDFLAGGSAMQRLWLTATAVGLQVQPEMTPVIFSRYIRERRGFTGTARLQYAAGAIAERLANLLTGRPLDHLVFLGRIGARRGCSARSVRLPPGRLMVTDQA